MMSKRTNDKQALTAEQAQAERDALRVQAAQAKTAEQAYAVLDGLGLVETSEQAQAERDALSTARLRGAMMWTAYGAIITERGGKVSTPRETEFGTVRQALGIDAKPDARKGETFTPWHGVQAFTTAQQAYNLHQWAAEDGLITTAHALFCSAHPKQANAWLGARASGLIGLATFARRTQQADKDGATMMPSSGTPAQRRDLLVARCVEKGDAVLAKVETDEAKVSDKQIALVDKLESPSNARFVETVPGLSSMTVSMWKDEEIAALIEGLRLVKGWTRPAAEQAEQAEQVAALAEQAEQAETAPEQGIPAADPATIAAIVAQVMAAQAAQA